MKDPEETRYYKKLSRKDRNSREHKDNRLPALFNGLYFSSYKFIHLVFLFLVYRFLIWWRMKREQNLLSSSSCTLSLYHLVSTFIGILLTFSPMHFLGFNVIPRRVPDFPDSFHSWNFLSSIGSGITFLSFAMFS